MADVLDVTCLRNLLCRGFDELFQQMDALTLAGSKADLAGYPVVDLVEPGH